MISKPRVRSCRLHVEDAEQFDRICRSLGLKKTIVLENLIKTFNNLFSNLVDGNED